MQDLNIFHLPLNKIRLIEASAGTGKTYSLIILYLRLLLNLHSNQSIYSTPLTVKEILVVTFTNSAAYDLRKRIKESIQQFRWDCMNKYSNNYIFSKLLLQIRNIDLAITLLFKAEKEIYEASIFTIHGFCQKILTENTLELNIPFHTSIIEDELTLYRQICFDFWRRHFYELPLNITSFIQEFWNNPEELLQNLRPYIGYHNNSKIQNPKFFNQLNKYISEFYNQILFDINNIKKQWVKTTNNLTKIINNMPNFNRKIYNKKNLAQWINIINQWCEQPTLNHVTPNALKRFRLSILNSSNNLNEVNVFSLFNSIDQLFQKFTSFKFIILNSALKDIQNNLNVLIYSKSQITFNNIITILLKNGIENTQNNLTKKILKYYPITIIDEFQDTDFSQYKIFHKLYSHSLKNGLILLGDPKQAIYGFRGADIFTYMKIRQNLSYKYHLNINWRSSPGMVNAINHLFQSTTNPFKFKDISFIPTQAAYKNNRHKLMIHNIPQSAMCFWLYLDKCVTKNSYKTIMAQECAITLKKLIQNINDKKIWLKTNTDKKTLQTSDITILVRNHLEASLIRLELLKINISTIFLSNRNNIFNTIEAYELLLLLRAILFPKQETIYPALATIFFGLNAMQIVNVYNNTLKWDQIINEFSKYYFIWKNNSILSMIQKIIFYYKIPKKLLSTPSGKYNLINILHLGELLNNISTQFNNEYELIIWLELKINQPLNQYKKESMDYMVRSNRDDHNCIKISTIHKSKGLEFPLTFLPFAATSFNAKAQNTYITHFKYQLNLKQHNLLHSDFDLLNEEHLSENLRLLYVAITRSIYHCSIGIAPIVRNRSQNSFNELTDFHRSALGYLIQNNTPNTLKSIKQYLQQLSIRSNKDITFRIISKKNQQYTSNTTTKFVKKPQLHLLSKIWQPSCMQIRNNSRQITSYSNLKFINNKVAVNVSKLSNFNLEELYQINLNSKFTKESSKLNLLTTHTFPKGQIYGTFFHNLLKVIIFKQTIDMQWLKIQMERYNVHLNWKTLIHQWIYTIKHTPINHHNLTLSKIRSSNIQTEMKFSLSIKNCLTAQKLDSLCKFYDELSSKTACITFPDILGMLQGFIDVVFYWNKKYYLLDYKTNWLGSNNFYYNYSSMQAAMIKYRYELQYQLYTIAIHRFLKHKIVSYNYEKDFGGIYYLFIRGMNGISHKNGIFFHRPSWDFIHKLNNLIS
ncbi:exodeoxyribonuclease V, beta subunit [Candidatus Blochmanniella vafra str. BVAF]|uniref:RecBCD enzyme subunit RecB n=1 Tax=Blochmanniella vafra (strain BVAF) TaxID=859654 RepID=E8Q653_BLOVB|nr:exodeoxyribonuclease V subunit beta [Candidatus Blochmannia vafer]ADV33669.1 exodeoxyribonuclease V, beta subunit [Candidatus Blochmannia vafer str. BVAF]